MTRKRSFIFFVAEMARGVGADLKKARLLFFVLPTLAVAGPSEYKCTVHSELSVADDGQLKPYRVPLEVGKSFQVDRTSGAILGALLRNPTASEIRVLQRGDQDRTFELLSVSAARGKATTDLLVVHEFVRSSKKPFVAITSIGQVYAGVCD